MESSSPSESARRIAALVVAISCHLGLFVLLLRPTTPHHHAIPIVENDALAIQLRFIPLPQPASPPLRPVAPPPPPTHHTKQPAAQPSAETPANRPITLATPSQYTNNAAPTSDGGFQEQLQHAEHANDIRGVPGSDTRITSGIELINPMNQGIGSVMRSTQRLFGIPSRVCIDIDTWRHSGTNTETLIAHHLSSSDVDKLAEKYSCNKPMGLSF